jgi:Ribbon-helix-helix protein, copG family
VKKTSLYLDPDLDEALARRAADEGLTKAEFIRRTLAGAMSRPPRVKPEAVALVKDGKRSVARDIDAYLSATGFGEWR